MIWEWVGAAQIELHMRLTSALDEGEWLASHCGHAVPRKRAPSIQQTEV
jgi:hypothetical protein